MAVGKKLRFKVLQRDGFKCIYCGASAPAVALEVDHIIPRAKGGSDKQENLVAACESCNRGKSASALSRADALRLWTENAFLSRWPKQWQSGCGYPMPPCLAARLRLLARKFLLSPITAGIRAVAKYGLHREEADLPVFWAAVREDLQECYAAGLWRPDMNDPEQAAMLASMSEAA